MSETFEQHSHFPVHGRKCLSFIQGMVLIKQVVSGEMNM